MATEGLLMEPVISNSQRSVRQMFASSSPLPRNVANGIGNFNAQGFRMTAVSWFISNKSRPPRVRDAGIHGNDRFCQPRGSQGIVGEPQQHVELAGTHAGKVMFGMDRESYNNEPSMAAIEAALMGAWRQEGPLGTLFAIVNYIKTPQQYNLFKDYQCKANTGLPKLQQDIKMPVKPVVTRWNSYTGTFQRAVELRVEHSIRQILCKVFFRDLVIFQSNRRNSREHAANSLPRRGATKIYPQGLGTAYRWESRRKTREELERRGSIKLSEENVAPLKLAFSRMERPERPTEAARQTRNFQSRLYLPEFLKQGSQSTARCRAMYKTDEVN
ncbi:hypothetical protein BU25DRAFT_420776 [Macroventuria anomochaeta]|uniref:Uncharacterized protein n=1 Tax=Macroventuria anomochaeta TaxID=301207 RepID=A0ACB6S5Q0_9PLEO|nr:uncharacterized protein BU25DRAFT_420776 [Macroventuria anomochaeta]KAF2628842.1 hypothetical protein BU25DRAFT_420776 [Macroventuria anomochaeta]